MPENKNVGSSGQEGSSAIANAPASANLSSDDRAGQASKGSGVDYERMYKELESKFGAQGNELGEYRNFIEGITPLLEKLDASPELAKAIVEGKIDSEVAKAALEGKITLGEAKQVQDAHKEVKKELGQNKYEAASPDEIAKLIEDKVNAAKVEMEKRVSEAEELRSFERSVQDFIERTPDFAEYAAEIDTWLDEHDTTDIQVAYYAVKGQISEREAKKKAEEDGAENAKRVAMNAAGGSGEGSFIPKDSEAIDSLISHRSNPNIF